LDVAAIFISFDFTLPNNSARCSTNHGRIITDVSILLDRTKLKAVMVGGKLMSTNRTTYDAQMVSDFSMTWWNDLYTQERVRELRRISESIKL